MMRRIAAQGIALTVCIGIVSSALSHESRAFFSGTDQSSKSLLAYSSGASLINSGYRLQSESQTEREPRATIWLGYSAGSGLGAVPISYETFQETSSYEFSLGALTVGGPTGSSSVILIGAGANFYSAPGFGSRDYQNFYYGIGASGAFASGGGSSTSSWSVGAYAGYRFNFNRFSARLQLGASYFGVSGSGWGISGFVFPVFSGGFGFIF